MSFDYQALKDEINNDPATKGYAGKTDQQIADLVNIVDNINQESIPQATILKWSTGNNLLDRLNTGQDDTGKTANERSAARCLMIAISSPHTPDYDPQDSDNIAAMDELVTATIMTSTEKTELQAFGDVLRSRGYILNLGTVNPGQVAKAKLWT